MAKADLIFKGMTCGVWRVSGVFLYFSTAEPRFDFQDDQVRGDVGHQGGVHYL